MVALPALQAAGAIRAVPRDIRLEGRLVEAVVAVVGFLGGGRIEFVHLLFFYGASSVWNTIFYKFAAIIMLLFAVDKNDKTN